jgi:hypothetical protein
MYNECSKLKKEVKGVNNAEAYVTNYGNSR